MNKKESEFWRKERIDLDNAAKKRIDKAQGLIDKYDLKFKDKIRDLQGVDLVRVSEFYPLSRQIIGTVAKNYPKLFFTIQDDAGTAGVSQLLERAAQNLMRLTQLREHVHQGIMDALFAQIGWIRVDFNPDGDELIPPYVANDAMAEDLVSFNRVAPGFVRVDPMCPPHMLGHARYISEKMWVPRKQLIDDKNIKHREKIKAASPGQVHDIGFGEVTDNESEEEVRNAITNGEFVLVERIHSRMDKKLIMFAEGIDEPIMEKQHPFTKQAYDLRMGVDGQPLMDENEQPIIDVESGTVAPGWLVPNGFPFIPIKFDLHPTNFYPMAQMAYVEDLQMAAVESITREASLLKRASRIYAIANSELEENPEISDILKKAVDGERVGMEDPDNIKALDPGPIPPGLYEFQSRIRFEIDRITKVNELGTREKTATEAALIGASSSINEQWAEAAVSRVYENCVRAGFQIMGDPRYTPENFIANTAPDDQVKASRVLQMSDFLWNYRIHVQTGSMQPLFAELEQNKFLEFYDRAINSPNYDRRALDLDMAKAFDMVDEDRLLIPEQNPDADVLAQLENDRIVSQQQDVGVQPGQKHQRHLPIHQQYQENPAYILLMQTAQQADEFGRPIDPEAAQRVQEVDQLMQQHVQAHMQAMDQEQTQEITGASPRGNAPDSVINQVRSNAQTTGNAVKVEAQEQMG